MSMRIRPAEPSDSVHFSRIGAATFALACPPSTAKSDVEAYIAAELTASRFEEHMACSANTFFAAVVNEEVVGYLMLSREQPQVEIIATNPLEVRRLYVLPEYHGSGVAGALMAQAIATASAAAHDALWLGVSKLNDRGIAFYRKHGFTVVGEKHFTVGSDIHDDLIMLRGNEARAPDAVSVQALRELLDSAEPPLLLDVRRPHAFAESPDTIPGAARRLPESVDAWADELPANRHVVAYCVHGWQVSQDVAARLEKRGIKASFLEGGIEQWRSEGGPLATAPDPLTWRRER